MVAPAPSSPERCEDGQIEKKQIEAMERGFLPRRPLIPLSRRAGLAFIFTRTA